MKYFLVVPILLSACSWPINPDKMADVIQALGHDTASGCFAVAGRAGGATMATGPVIPGGAYGSGEVLFARVNAPGTKITLTINGASCVIERDNDTTLVIGPESRFYTTKP